MMTYQQFIQTLISNPQQRTCSIDSNSFQKWIDAVEDNTFPHFQAGKTCQVVLARVHSLERLIGVEETERSITQTYNDF